ncbi:hypothetical protein B0H14DRAFT_2563858 [Mycena olivaceomarginata]|nr:hypothetical protein B0H14DRAFT_2563858 [Mycena olivaceomarginata]
MTKCDHLVLTWSKSLGFGVIYKRKCIGSSESTDYTGVHVELEHRNKVLLREVGGALLREGTSELLGFLWSSTVCPGEDEERHGTGRRGRRRERYGGREIWEGGQSDRSEWMGQERQGMEGVQNGLWGWGWGGERGAPCVWLVSMCLVPSVPPSGDELGCTTTEMVGGSMGGGMASGNISGDRIEKGREGREQDVREAAVLHRDRHGQLRSQTLRKERDPSLRLAPAEEVLAPHRLSPCPRRPGSLPVWERRQVKPGFLGVADGVVEVELGCKVPLAVGGVLAADVVGVEALGIDVAVRVGVVRCCIAVSEKQREKEENKHYTETCGGRTIVPEVRARRETVTISACDPGHEHKKAGEMRVGEEMGRSEKRREEHQRAR